MHLGYWLFSDEVIAVSCYTLVIVAFMLADYFAIEGYSKMAVYFLGH